MLLLLVLHFSRGRPNRPIRPPSPITGRAKRSCFSASYEAGTTVIGTSRLDRLTYVPTALYLPTTMCSFRPSYGQADCSVRATRKAAIHRAKLRFWKLVRAEFGFFIFLAVSDMCRIAGAALLGPAWHTAYTLSEAADSSIASTQAQSRIYNTLMPAALHLLHAGHVAPTPSPHPVALQRDAL